jgi:SCY1-like protein 2
VYNALDSEHAVVQERALKVVPDLCETIDYAEVQGVLFPRVAVRHQVSTTFLPHLN